MQCPYVIINVTNGVDTMKCMTATCTLYESMNVQPFSNFIEFSDFLYTNLYSKGKPLLVSCDYYDKLKKEEIQEVPKIKAVFEERGIEGLLSEYPEGYQMVDLMVTDYASFKYLIYLCWLNDIFWFIPEPSYIAVYWSKDWIIKDTKWKTTINKLWYLYKSDNSIRKLKGEMIHRM